MHCFVSVYLLNAADKLHGIVAILAVTDLLAVAIQFDVAGEAVRLEREARRARGELYEISRQQPALLEQLAHASVRQRHQWAHSGISPASI